MTEQRPFPIRLVVAAVIGVLIGVGLAVLVLATNTVSNQTGQIAIATSSRNLLREGLPAPEWALKTLDGKPTKLADLRGKPALVNFWASWCPPCIEETPALIQAYKELKSEGRNVEFVGIGTNDDLPNLQKFAANNTVPYLLVADTDGKVSEAYGVLGMPTTVLIDGNGIVRRIVNGAVKKDQVLEWVRALN